MSRAGDGVADDDAVVSEGLQSVFRDGADGVRCDQLGDVHGVGIGRVFHPGGCPQRPLHVAAGVAECGITCSGFEHVLIGRIGQASIGDCRLSAQRHGGIGADRFQPLIDFGIDPGDEQRSHRMDSGEFPPGVLRGSSPARYASITWR